MRENGYYWIKVTKNSQWVVMYYYGEGWFAMDQVGIQYYDDDLFLVGPKLVPPQ